MKSFLAVVTALFVLIFADRADATHFRYGHIRYTIPDPVNKPLEVKFEVTVAWRSTFLDSVVLNYGDGAMSPATMGSSISQGFTAAGHTYLVQRLTTTHTYPAPSSYNVNFTSCCRISTLANAADATFLVGARVDLTPGNTGNAATLVPSFVQLPVGGVRTLHIPAIDPDGVPVSCRFATPTESGDSAAVMPPVAVGNAAAPTIVATSSPPGCLLSWNLAGASASQSYAVQVILESSNASNGIISASAVDFVIDTTLAPPPTCSPNTSFVVDMGQLVTTGVMGTNNSGGTTLTSSAIGAIVGLTPVAGTMAASPFSSTFAWTPGAGDVGTHFHSVLYTDPLGLSCHSTQAITVRPCPQYGQLCSAGIGACQQSGILQCVGASVVCTAVAGQPTPEVCNNIDDDCNGVIDQNNPGSGMPCATMLSGICDVGVTNCNTGVLACVPNFAPGSVAETCDGNDQNCDGVIDDGFNVGAACSGGIGACQATGQIVCNGMGGATCSVMPGMPTTEICDAIDNDCNGTIDNGFSLGNVCAVGIGACATSGIIVCNAMGGASCSVIPGTPVFEVCGDNIDNDCNGVIDNGCGDADSDGLANNLEDLYGTDKNDADSDDDGLLDGDEIEPATDTDNDGLINALDADSDDDGLTDGTELGIHCGNPATNKARGFCRPDADLGQTTTDPLDADSDNDGKSDGAEDANLNGTVESSESNPQNNGDADKTVDFDGDGLGDALEAFIGSNAQDADSDDDGLLDGAERNPSLDHDGDGLIDTLDVDSDDDALFDGLEEGKNCQYPATNALAGHCRADLDSGTTKTSALLRDTDQGGVMDGSEDVNHDGVVSPVELDPRLEADDNSAIDTDKDGLTDALEATLGTNLNDTDSDDDGLPDGEEPNPSDDNDGDMMTNVMDPDSDGDGLFDGTEAGRACNNPDTAPAAMHCIADADGGNTTTIVLVADTDGGSKSDGDEDANKNGAIDNGEKDPLDASDDTTVPADCVADGDCGSTTSGKVCENQKCIDGCRGAGGNGCPREEVCSSTDMTMGTCSTESTPPPPDTDAGGCDCRTASHQNNELPGIGLLAGLALAIRRRRRG